MTREAATTVQAIPERPALAPSAQWLDDAARVPHLQRRRALDHTGVLTILSE
jgi:hypothetical protein